MKTTPRTLLALTLALGLHASAQDQPKAPPVPVPPAPKTLSKEELDARAKKAIDELQKAKAAQTNAPAAVPVPTRRPPTAPTALTPSPGAPAVSVSPATAQPGVPAVPAAQQPAAPPAPGQTQIAPPAPGAPAPAVPSGQIVPARAGAVAGGAFTNTAKVLPAGFLQLQNAPKETWMDIYEKLTGRTILRANALPEAQISIKSVTDLTVEEAIQALEHVLVLNQITAVKIGDKFVELVPSASALQSGAAFSNKTAKELPESAQYITQIVKLEHALPSEVSQAVAPFARTPNGIIAVDSTQTLIMRDYAINVKRMMEVIEEIDKAIPSETDIEVIPIKYALVADISAVLSSFTSSGSTGVAGGTAGSTARRTSTGVGGTTRRSGTTGGLGVSTGQGGQQGGFGTQQTQRPGGTTLTPQQGAPGAINTFQNNLQRIVQNASQTGGPALLGNAQIIPMETSNSLLVLGTKEERMTVRKVIEQIDLVMPQVLIEAVVVEVQLTDGRDTGVSIGQTPKQFGKDFLGFGGSRTTAPFGSSITNANPLGQLGSGLSYFGLIGNNWEVAMTAVANDARFEVLSRPRIQATHAVEADIFVGETRPFPTGSTTFGGQATTQIQNQRIGIGLNVLPLINAEGLVVLDIAQTVQQLGEDIQIDANFSTPAIIDRSATSRVAVNNGDTIILGGFITTEKRVTKSGVPGLKDIPGLGRLFSSKSESIVKRELIVLLRVTVLPTPEIAAVFAGNEREKMVDVKKTEQDLRRDEQERYRKLEAEMEKANRKRK